MAGEGPASAGLMLVGEQPGDQDGLAGVPFADRGGDVLDRAMQGVGIGGRAVYLTNGVKHVEWETR